MFGFKEYVCVMQLHKQVDEQRLLEVIKEFIGKIYQKPPVRSSVKRALRVRTVYYIDVLEINHPYVLMRVGCEHGTYMRKLCYDIGLVLGVGAHMRELRRTRTGPFTEDKNLVTLHQLSEALYAYRELGDESMLRKVIMPIEYAISHLKKVVIRDTAVEAIAHGANLMMPGILRFHDSIRKGDLVAILTLKGELVALGKALVSSKEMAELSKGMAIKTDRVVIPKGLYPRAWKRKGEGK